MSKFLFTVPLRDLILSEKGIKPVILKNMPFENCMSYLDINALESGNVREYTYKELGTMSTEGDCLVVWDGSRSGLVFKGQAGIIGSTIMRLTPIELLPNYLYWFLKYNYELINANTIGNSIPHVDSDLFFKLEVPYTYPQNQQKILRELDSKILEKTKLLSDQKDIVLEALSSTKIPYESNDDVKRSIRNFRQSVLQMAITGELTKEWRKKNKNFNYVKLDNSKLDLSSFGNISLPESWTFTSMDAIATLQQGMQISKNRRFNNYVEGRLPLLRIKNYTNNFTEDVEYIDVTESTLIAEADDIILARTGETRGKVLTGVRGVFHNNTFRINFNEEKVLKQYLIFVLESSFVNDFIIKNTMKGNHPDLSHKVFNN